MFKVINNLFYSFLEDKRLQILLLAKVRVASSSLVFRSKKRRTIASFFFGPTPPQTASKTAHHSQSRAAGL